MEFMMGRLDFLSGLHPVYKDELITREGKLNPVYTGRIKMITEPYLNTEYLGFLLDPEQEAVQNSPVLIREVRQAINIGFDRHKMMRYLRNNIGRPAGAGFVPEGLPSYNAVEVSGFEYDPDRGTFRPKRTVSSAIAYWHVNNAKEQQIMIMCFLKFMSASWVKLY